MPATAAWTALAMGLMGGPHCLAMCAASCGAITQRAGAGEGQPLRRLERSGSPPRSSPAARPLLAFHAGRLAGYALAGGMAAAAMDRLAWLSQQSAALRPAWTLLHVAVLAWAVLMMVQARQPRWIEALGRGVWQRVRPWLDRPGGTLLVGAAWALMPCGLLYSALLVAALSGSVWQGAASMALFGAGGAVWLLGGRWAWSQLRDRLDRARGGWGTRVAGLLLFGFAAWAIWVDAQGRDLALWCA